MNQNSNPSPDLATTLLNDPSAATLHQLVEVQARKTPDAVALRFEGQQLTYAQLNGRANQCAHFLRGLGMGPNRIIGVLMARSIDRVVGLLGILKSGAAWLPLDPDYPRQRLNFILEDAGVSVVLTQAAFEVALNQFDGTVLSLDREWEFVAEEVETNPTPLALGEHPAYVIYTSGSTGQPKGCLVPHRAICNRLVWMRDAYQIGQADKVLQKTPYTFDVSVWELFLPLLSGACEIIAKPDGHRDANYLVELINGEGVTVCHFVPSMLRFFLGQGQAKTCKSLRHVFSSGEALPFELMSQWLDTLPAKLHNLYGPTEAAVDVSFWECRRRDDGKVPIGRPITHIQLHVLDDSLRPVANGEAGELHIGGVGLALGYLNRPELTKRAFIANPFSQDGGVLYKTGDRARLLGDGNLEYLGRLDNQVKLRGFRIELGEIEAALKDHSAVSDAAVAVQDKDSGDPKLVAYLVSTDPGLTPKQVRQYVKDRLPEYMTPNGVGFLDELPVSRHGKLDKKALPWPLQAADKLVEPVAAPARVQSVNHDKVLADVLAAFSGLIMVDQLKADDDLFDMGATSLTIVLMVEKIQTEFGVGVPVDVIMDSPDVASITRYVVDHLDGDLSAVAEASNDDVAGDARVAKVDVEMANPVLELGRVNFNDDAYNRVSIVRRFSAGTVTTQRFGGFLSLLKQGQFESKAKYLYASAGDLNGIQTYIYVRAGAVQGLESGVYYYHPETHQLHLISSKPQIPTSAFMAHDRDLFEQAGFAVFFIAQMDAIRPVYGAAGSLLAVLEAGYMAQLLISRAADFGLGLSPAAGVNFKALSASFVLDKDHQFIHCLLAGPADSTAREPWSLADHLQREGDSYKGSFDAFLQSQTAGAGFPSKEDKDRLRAERRHIRQSFPESLVVSLTGLDVADRRYAARSCKRTYLNQPVSFEQMRGLLAMLGPKQVSGRDRYLYPSISAFELKVYLYVEGGGVEGLDAGLYRYHPRTNRLEPVASQLSTQIKLCYTPFNRKHAQHAKFHLFLIAPLGCWRQTYGEDSTWMALLEAGHIGQMLLDRQAEFHLGICPIGGLMFDKIRLDFKLEAGDELIHSFVGGGFDLELPTDWSFLETPADQRQQPAANPDLAIVGVSGRYPGADNTDEYLALLQQGRTGFSQLSFDASSQYRSGWDGDGRFNHHGGFLKGVDCFDARLFKMLPAEARSIDPQERLLLEAVWESLENGGYTGSELNRLAGRVGVFTGSMWSEYQQHGGDWQDAQATPAVSFQSSMANRISHFFGFNGPSIAVNTSCSSAMTALHYACKSIAAGDCRAAVVGGVNLMSHPYHLGLLSTMDFLSKQKEPRPFGLNADGWVPGEGVGVVIIKPLADAERDGDHIHGVIKGTAVAFSGQAGRYGAPSSEKQKESILTVIENADVGVHTINYIEAAVPGAGMADALETIALKEVFQHSSERPVHIGSVKANIGHLESASAMSQLTKVLLQMKQRQIFPTLNTQPLNPMVQLEHSGLEIAADLIPWQNPHGPRRALINAFGATGSSGHVIVEEYPAPKPEPESGMDCLVPISAATPPQLRQCAQQLHDFLAAGPTPPLPDIAHTLRVGRVAMAERLAVIANSVDDLKQKLGEWLENQEPKDCFEGSVCDDPEPAGDGDLHRLAKHWVSGGDLAAVDSGGEGEGPKRTPLPTYPFARESYWVAGPDLAESGERVDPKPEPQRDADGVAVELEARLVALFAQITELPAAEINTSATFDDYGINSYIITQLNLYLEKDFGRLPKTLLFEYQTIDQLTGFFLERHAQKLKDMFGAPTNGGQDNPLPEPQRNPVQDPQRPTRMAVIGVSGRYPKSNDINDLWENLKAGVDCISEIPAERWDYRDFEDSAGSIAKWGGFIEGVDLFDPLFFKMSPLEAEALDPQERLFLETTWHTLEDANYNREALKETFAGGVGVFVGVMSSDYQLFSAPPEDRGGWVIGSSFGSIANRVSYVFDFHGPSMALDTLCSSSLTALHLAVESIRRNECMAAIVGGVNLSIHPNKYIIQSRLTMPSSDGRCRSFGEGGDGFIPGEGVGAVFIKPLHLAERDGDQIHAVIRGTSINHDGKTHGYTVPNPNAQAEMITRALQDTDTDPAAVSYIEAHGTGTSLGDPVEIAGLTKAFQAHTHKTQFCALGSIKSNIGHLEAAAGIAGLTKILLQMKHGLLAPSLHSKTLNPNIDFEESPFYVQQELAEWKRPVHEIDGQSTEINRIAGLSSFGAGGSNAHAVIEEYRGQRSVDDEAGAELAPYFAILLSAKDKARLRDVADNLNRFLAVSKSVGIANLAYTLWVGREPMEERLAFTAASIGEVQSKLSIFLSNRVDGDDIHSGRARIQRQTFTAEIETCSEAVQKWVRGTAVDWTHYFGSTKPRRIALPLYPFARERYWLPQSKAKPQVSAPKPQAQNPKLEDHQLLCFEESWREQVLPTIGGVQIRTLICIVSDGAQQADIQAGLKKLDPSLHTAFVVQGDTGQALEGVSRELDSVDAVLYLCALEDAQWTHDVGPIVTLVQSLARAGIKPSRLLLAGGYRNDLEYCHTQSWIGLTRSLRTVLPDTRAQVVMAPVAGGPMDWLETLWAELNSGQAASVSYLDDKRHVLKLDQAELPETGPPESLDGAVLITGGLGGLGLVFARHLMGTRGVDVILTGRSALSPEQESELKKLETMGGRVYYLQADVCDAAAMADGLEIAKTICRPIRGVIHAAGLEPMGHILEKSGAAFRAASTAKIDGPLVLDDALGAEPLDFVCYFSSTAAILGDWGCGDYAMGNRFLMAYAHYRNGLLAKGERRGRALVLNWPMWQGGGMGGDEDQAQAYLNASGQRLLTQAEGLGLFDQCLHQNRAQMLFLAARPNQVGGLLGLMDGAAVSRPAPGAASKRPQLRGLTLEQSIRWDLKAIISELLKIGRDRIDNESDLTDYGFDSIGLARFAEVLTGHYGFDVAPSVFFGHATLTEIARYFLAEHNQAMQAFYQPAEAIQPPKPQRVATAAPTPARNSFELEDDIAIIGMSGRFPQARSVDEMWRLLAEGENAVQEIPADRFDWRDYYGDPSQDPGKTNCKWTGSIPGVAEFDPLFFEISPREAERMDPRQRLLLQEAWNALEDAGFGAHHIEINRTGMFVGVEEGEYQRLATEGDLTSFHTGILAARLAYFLNLKGPTMAINTACSSGLVAAHQACQSLRSGECDTAIAAGVNLMLTPDVYIGMTQAGILSASGACFTFDKRADGMVPGEAVAVLVLKRLSKAIEDGDPIHAVIRGSGVNYDGKTSGITAPSGVSQTQLIQSVYQRYGISPQSIDYIVAHGTGTPLGDSVEINALDKAFAGVNRRGSCALTSTKTNFGHTFAASGLVSVIGLVQALRHETIPASLHCEHENDHINWQAGPFYVNKTKRAWPLPANGSRTGAVSSFGMSGTNAHMVVREHVGEGLQPLGLPCYLLALSAKTPEALTAKISEMTALLEGDGIQDLAAVSYTLLEGRHHFRYRCALVIQDREDAWYLLQQAGGSEKFPVLFEGTVPREFEGQKALHIYGRQLIKESLAQVSDPRKYQESLCALAELYCQGYDFAWHDFLGDTPPRRINLPTYPFSREQFWIGQTPNQPHQEEELQPAPRAIAPSVPTQAAGKGRRMEMAGLTVAQCLEWDLKEHMSAILKISRDKLESNVELTEFGFDSIRLAELSVGLGKFYDLEIVPSVFFGYPTLEKLTPHLLKEHGDVFEAFYRDSHTPQPAGRPVGSTAVRRPKPQNSPQPSVGSPAMESIAIIGMSGRFPQARNIDDMWRILVNGENAVTEIPQERFDWRPYYDPSGNGQTNSKWMGCLPDVGEFDALFFEISPREAEKMDPRQRLLLQEAWKALEDAGYGKDQLAAHQVGMFVGVEQDDYQALRGAEGGITASHNGVLAGRLAYFLNLTGPNMAINTACSSGLVAAHQAWLSLRNGECDLALAAGVNLVLTTGMFVGMSQSGMLSPDGRCYAFDRRANGMVPGEAVAVLVFKRLSQAERDGDPIYAVIQGSGVNYDGKTNGITAPSGVSQAQLLNAVYERHQVNPEDLDYIVTHGTGTKLGDPIEINALAEVFKSHTDRTGYCALTSTKTNFGHTFAASGLVSLISLVQAMRHETIPASLHCEQENDFIQWRESPFFVNRANRNWPALDGRSRMGAVSAFGISGTNAHMVIRDYADRRATDTEQPPCFLLVLSAQSQKSLRDRVSDMVELLQHGTPNLSAIAHTLLTGRHHFQHRCAIVVRNAQSAAYLLQRVGGPEKLPNLFEAKVPRGFSGQKVMEQFGADLLQRSRDQFNDPDQYQETLYALADLYCQGYDLAWRDLFGEHPAKVRLPGYPFEREHHWVSAPAQLSVPGVSAVTIHPLLHQNTSDFSTQRFCSTFTGQEPFLADHVVNGRKVLPGVVSLEMARAAVARSCGCTADDMQIRFKNVVWQQPVVVDGPTTIHMDLMIEDDDWVRYQIYTEGSGDDPQCVIHAQGLAQPGPLQPVAGLDLPALQAGVNQTLDHQSFYAVYQTMGMDYGQAHRGVESLYLGDGMALARLVLPTSVKAARDQYVLHPSIMDAAFQTPIGLFSADSESTAVWLPFALEQLEVRAPVNSDVWVLVREDAANSNDTIKKVHLDLCDDNGAILVKMVGFSSRKAQQQTAASSSITLQGNEFYLLDHHGILPGVMCLEMARAAASVGGREVGGLRQVVWREPITVTMGPRQIFVGVSADGPNQVCTINTRDQGVGKVHFQGVVADLTEEREAAAPLPLQEIQARCMDVKTRDQCNQLLHGTHGPSIQTIETLYHNGMEALAQLRQPHGLEAQLEAFELNPSLMNGAVLGSVIHALIQDPGMALPLPFGLDELQICDSHLDIAFAYVKRASSSDRVKKYDIHLLDSHGVPAVFLKGLSLMVSEPAGVNRLFATQSWQPQELTRAGDSLSVEKPVFVLTQASDQLAGALRDKWPACRIETLESSEQSRAESVQANFVRLFELVRTCATQQQGPLVILAAEDEFPANHASLSGLLKTARSEQLDLNCKLIFYPLEGLATGRLLQRLVAEVATVDDDQEVRFTKSGSREVKRVREIDLPTQDAQPKFKQGGAVWITGGLGGLGLIFARYYGLAGARIIISGRSDRGDKLAALEALQQEGVEATYLQGDVCDKAWVVEMVKTIEDSHGGLTGIIHSAGVVRDAYLLKKTAAEIEAVFQPKVTGVLAIDEATQAIDLDFMVLFSSLAGVIGNPGQGDYAGANAFLDAFAVERNRWVENGLRHGKTLSISWPLWKDGGMRMDRAAETLMEQATGMTAMDTAVGLETFNRALQGSCSHVLVAQGSLEKIRSRFQPKAPEVAETRPKPQPTTKTDGIERLHRELIQQVADLQQISPEKIELEAEWSVYGFDSIGLTELANSLNKAYGLELMPTIFYEHSTPAALAVHLVEICPDLLIKTVPEPQPAVQPIKSAMPATRLKTSRFRSPKADGAVNVAHKPQPIAVIGMHGRFPGSTDLEDFWSHLEACDDLITLVPPDRWDWRSYYGDPQEGTGKTKVNAGGFIHDVDCFDPLFFGISPREAETMDPQFRLFLETVWAAVEDAGYAASSLAGSRTGVFVGASSTDYKELWQAAAGGANGGTPVIYHFIIANRISYLLDLHGPSEAIDTACSSSLIAIHRAIESIRQGNCDMALAGGVNVITSPNLTLVSSMSGMLSEDGRCRTFDRTANGYGRGEGVGAVFLKPLDKAIEAGDQIFGLIRGSAENHGGRATSPTAPNPVSQQALLVAAYGNAGIDPKTITYMEAHGTGTKLGDPIEINGLKGAFKQLYAQHGHPTPTQAHCAVGSIKSNIGHLEAAAGIAGVIKILMMLKHHKIPGNVHLHNQNPYLQLEESPFYLVGKTQSWPRLRDADQQPVPRRAGISSFGIGGSNAHLVMEEYLAPPQSKQRASQSSDPHVIVLSAKTQERLDAMAANLLTFLEKPATIQALELADLAHTLRVGRDAMKIRLAFCVHTLEQLKLRLQQFLEDKANADVYFGELESHSNADSANTDPAIEGLFENRDHAGLARLWVQGLSVNWKRLYGEEQGRRISLPVYPFARQRYWVPQPEKSEPEAPAPKAEPQWLFMKEHHRAQAIPDDLDWVGRLKQYQHKSIVVVYSRQQDCDNLCQLLEQLEQAAEFRDPLQVRSLSIDDLSPDAFEQAPDVVLFLGPRPGAGGMTPNPADVAAVFRLSQCLMKKVWGEPVRIFYIYETAADQPRLDCRALSGFVKSAMMENELHTWKMIEHAAGDQSASYQLLVKEWLFDEPTDLGPMAHMEVRLDGADRWVKELTPTTLTDPAKPVFRQGGTYVLAGGMGYIGELLAGKLAQVYGANLVILSRRTKTEAAQDRCRELEALGARVFYHAVDIADPVALEATFVTIKREVGEIHGVVNLTRAHEDCMIATKPWDSFQRVIRSKVSGSLNLDHVTRDEPLDFFILFSSLGAYGVRGSSDYAYATAFQNAFAHQRNHLRVLGNRSGMTVAQSWGAWVEDRLFPETRQKIQAQGFKLIDMDMAFPVISATCANDHGVVALMAVDDFDRVNQFMGLSADVSPTPPVLEAQVTQWEQQYPDGMSFETLTAVVDFETVKQQDPALIHRIYRLLRGPEPAAHQSAPSSKAPAAPAVAAAPATPENDLAAIILSTLTEVLKLEQIDPNEPFQNYGLDSISATVFATRLEKKLNREVPSQWLIDHATVHALSAQLAENQEDC